MTITEFLRNRILNSANIYHNSSVSPEYLRQKIARLESVRDWVWSHALPRLLMGGFRYEAKEVDGKSYDQKAREGSAKPYTERMIEKIRLYIETGNQEFLIDIFNYVILELLWPVHPNAHFKSTERHE